MLWFVFSRKRALRWISLRPWPGPAVMNKASKVYDLFRERVVFPIARYDGSVIAFGGRTMGDAVPKYLNSPESDVFSKRRNLYGLLQARDHMRRLNQGILVEGYMDCIKLHQAGINNAVASLGTAFTQEQADLIARYAESVIVIYDGDEAGQRETLRALDILENQDLGCYVLVLPPGKDPDELVSSMNATEVRQYIDNNRITGMEYRIKRLVDRHRGDGIEDKIKGDPGDQTPDSGSGECAGKRSLQPLAGSEAAIGRTNWFRRR